MQCPLCHRTHTSRTRLIDVGSVIDLWSKWFQTNIRPELHGIAQIELWRCVDCSIDFFAPQCLAGSAQMYCQLANYDWYYVARKWEYEAALVDLRGRQRILEIGCGSGTFMALAKEEGGLFVEGLEQNPQAVIEATRRGLVAREATAEDAAKQSPGMYDAICSFQVLEHLAKPKEFLDACCTLLRPSGLLVLAVPNQNTYIRFMINPLDMPPHHMTRWTRASFQRLQAHFPLKLVRIAYEPLAANHIESYVDTYTNVLRRRNHAFLLRPLIYKRIVLLIRRLALRGFIRGQNIYACYVKN